MSTATTVPETRGLSGDDAWALLRRTGTGRLLKDSFQRLRVADGFSHARSLAFLTTLILIQGLIGVVGLASALGKTSISSIIFATIRRTVPGPTGEALTAAVAQAHHVANTHHYTALIVGLLGALVTGTVAMGQFERGLNRIYGVEKDRPSKEKYVTAAVLTLSVGTLIVAAMISLAFGRDLFATNSHGAVAHAWSILRWPVGLVLGAVAITLLFQFAPRRKQPHLSWLSFGAAVAVVLWALVTIGLGLFYLLNSSFGKTYGPLAGIVALMMWCFLSSVVVLYGAALAAQLEAVRAGTSNPQDPAKVAASEPRVEKRRVPARS